MDTFADKLAVITGAGSGMGRDLAVKLSQAGADLALCDVNLDQLESTKQACARDVEVSTFRCDVAEEDQVLAFRDATMAAHSTDCVHLLFNNAGIGTTESFIEGDRDTWEKTFDVCWNGVYLSSRAFVPLLVAADEAHLINTSSINGFWQRLAIAFPHTSYSAAKFAVKGFTEALINEFRLYAPHVGVSLVMPGHIGTEIVANSRSFVGHENQAEVLEASAAFRNGAPTSSEDAADIILEGVRRGSWRILIGDDAHLLDAMVRADPEGAYEPEFVEELHQAGVPSKPGRVAHKRRIGLGAFGDNSGINLSLNL